MSGQAELFPGIALAPTPPPQAFLDEPHPPPRPRAPVLLGEQLAAREAILAFVRGAAPGDFFVLQGLAGVGKTVVVAALKHALPDALLVAPTGKAATVLVRKTGHPAQTLHSLLYVAGETEDGLVFSRRFEPGQLAGRVILVDEASMVDRELATDLLATGAVVIASGDPGQLPPVQGAAFFTQPDFTLTEIRRQAADSPIIRQAHRVRYGDPYTDDGAAFRIIRERSEENYGWADVVLCWRNDTRHRVNRFLRQRRGIAAGAPPQAGEPVICLQNDRYAGVMNGETFVLADDYQPNRPLHLVDGPRIEKPWFEPPRGEVKPPRRQTAFGLAYAITTHKAQGSEWPRVLILDEFRGEDRDRWVYTAITRASSEVRIRP